MKRHFVFVCLLFILGCQLQLDKDIEAKTNSPNEPELPLSPEVTNHPQDQSDVWERIAMQLEMPMIENPKLDHYRTWYLKNPHHLKTVSERATPFLYLITERIEKEGLPLEIALLPIVESSFDQYAYSHGSAAGLWQFMPETGRVFGLEQNWWYDGRKDVLASTDAAIKLLKYLHKKFNGNWSYALAAYNTGEGRVFRAIRNNKAKGLPTDFSSLSSSLPKETRDYFPKLLALADVIKNREKYGISLRAIPNKPVVEQLKLDVQMDLSIAADFAKIPLKQLQNLNPAYNHWATSPDGPYHLLLPIDHVESFKKTFIEQDAKGINISRYKVSYGDTLGHIALRYKTSVKSIQLANDLKQNRISEGQYLMVPFGQKERSQLVKKKKPTEKKKTHDYKLTHTVTNGDNISSLADKYGISQKNLLQWNQITSTETLHIGQKLLIWKRAQNGARIRTIVYEIQEGDVLSMIADKYHVSLSDLILWNALTENAYIQPGQELTLHVDTTKLSA